MIVAASEKPGIQGVRAFFLPAIAQIPDLSFFAESRSHHDACSIAKFTIVRKLGVADGPGSRRGCERKTARGHRIEVWPAANIFLRQLNFSSRERSQLRGIANEPRRPILHSPRINVSQKGSSSQPAAVTIPQPVIAMVFLFTGRSP